MTYTIFGAEESPYSVKTRSYFRYKNIPHVWKGRNEDQALYNKHARLPLIPLVVTPDGRGIQDSTPILETMERNFPNLSIHPTDPVARFISQLLEEFGDEWGNKWMFHFRWAREIDQIGCARRLARGANPTANDEQIEAISKQIQARMVDRVWFVGSNDITAPQIEQSFVDSLKILERHLESRPYLFGKRPAFADFGMWGQIYNANRDTTPAQFVSQTSNVTQWLERMLHPQNEGDFEDWQALSPTLTPLLSDQVGALFLPWSSANREALAAGKEEFDVNLASGLWRQKPQKYHARSLAALQQKYQEVEGNEEIDKILDDTRCLSYLTP